MQANYNCATGNVEAGYTYSSGPSYTSDTFDESEKLYYCMPRKAPKEFFQGDVQAYSYRQSRSNYRTDYISNQRGEYDYENCCRHYKNDKCHCSKCFCLEDESDYDSADEAGCVCHCKQARKARNRQKYQQVRKTKHIDSSTQADYTTFNKDYQTNDSSSNKLIHGLQSSKVLGQDDKILSKNSEPQECRQRPNTLKPASAKIRRCTLKTCKYLVDQDKVLSNSWNNSPESGCQCPCSHKDRAADRNTEEISMENCNSSHCCKKCCKHKRDCGENPEPEEPRLQRTSSNGQFPKDGKKSGKSGETMPEVLTTESKSSFEPVAPEAPVDIDLQGDKEMPEQRPSNNSINNSEKNKVSSITSAVVAPTKSSHVIEEIPAVRESAELKEQGKYSPRYSPHSANVLGPQEKRTYFTYDHPQNDPPETPAKSSPLLPEVATYACEEANRRSYLTYSPSRFNSLPPVPEVSREEGDSTNTDLTNTDSSVLMNEVGVQFPSSTDLDGIPTRSGGVQINFCNASSNPFIKQKKSLQPSDRILPSKPTTLAKSTKCLLHSYPLVNPKVPPNRSNSPKRL